VQGTNIEEGIALAQKALELKPDTAGYLATLSEIYYRKGDLDQAVSTIQQALACATGTPEKYWEALQRFEQAREE